MRMMQTAQTFAIPMSLIVLIAVVGLVVIGAVVATIIVASSRRDEER
jgi:hypothetical protein